MSDTWDVEVDRQQVEQLVRKGLDAVKASTRILATDLWGQVKAEAPVDEGRLAGSFQLESMGDLDWRIFTNVLYALMVQEGTGIFGPSGTPIVPVRASVLVFEINGNMVFARSVRGMQANEYVTRAMDNVQGRMDTYVDMALREVGAN